MQIAYFSDVENHAGKVQPPSVFIQWKGTDVCMDFHCACGAEGHFDGDFCYAIRCGTCRAIYEMPSVIALKKVESTNAIIKDAEMDGDDC